MTEHKKIGGYDQIEAPPTTYVGQTYTSPPDAGAYQLGDGPVISFHLPRKPSAWHRFWMRTCLGWVWKDAPCA